MARPATDPEVAVADLIVAATVSIGGSSAAKGTNLFHGPEQPASSLIPDTAIFCLVTGGQAPEPYIGIGEDLGRVAVTVRIRDKDFARGRATAQSAMDACQRGQPAGWVTVLCLQSEPGYIGKDDAEHHLWTFTAICTYKG